jgi:hypothetical protein
MSRRVNVKGLAAAGRILQRAREKACLTPETAAQMVGIPLGELLLIEAGDAQCHFEELAKYCWFAGKELDWRFVKAAAVKLTLLTNCPWDFVLLNEADGTRWRGTAEGGWVKEQPA